MPLRITIEVIPHGDESKKFLVARVDAVNNKTGTDNFGNYNVCVTGPVHGGGVDQWANTPRQIVGIRRYDGHFAQACEIMERMAWIKTEPTQG